MTSSVTHIHDRVSLQALNRLYKHSQDNGRSSPNDRRIGLFLQDNLICGLRLQHYSLQAGEVVWLMRNLCTLPQHRQQGYASQLIHWLQHRIQEPVYCYPLPELIDWYLQLGCKPTAPPSELLTPWRHQSRVASGKPCLLIHPATNT